jgi:methyl-accepting chemotaxis protein
MLAVMASMSVGAIGYFQAGAAGAQFDEALAVANTRVSVVDAQHTVAVVYADTNVLARSADGARSDPLAEMDAHAGELRAAHDELAAAHVGADVEQVLSGSFLPSIQTVLTLAGSIHNAGGSVTPATVAAVQQAWDAFDHSSDELTGLLDKAASGEAAASAQKSTDTRTTILIVAVLAVAAVAGASFVLARTITRPLGHCVTTLARVRDGDLTARVDSTSSDEIGQLARALDASAEAMATMVRQVAGNAVHLSSTSDELSNVSLRMTSSAEETSAQAGTVAGAAALVSENVHTVVAGAHETGASIREIASSAAEAATVSAGAAQAAQRTNDIVARLDQSSAEIGGVVKLITSIAEQTNLLALNATIEAARAGDAGRGFAVVAAEVKDLAQETAKATGDISRRVAAIQSETADAVAAISEITSVTTRINNHASTIAAAVEEQTAIVAEMTRSVTDAAGGANDIASTIAGVAQSADLTATGAAETQAASRNLATMATQLQETVSAYRV